MWGYDWVAVWMTLAVLGLSSPEYDQLAAEAAGCFLEHGCYVLGLRDTEESDVAGPSDWQVAAYRERLKSVADAPPLSDVARLPSWDVCQNCMCLNVAYCRWLKATWELDVAFRTQLAAVQEEADELWAVWSAAHSAGSPWAARWSRRVALKDLRERLGPYDYWLGRMPPPVPLHRFTRLDP